MQRKRRLISTLLVWFSIIATLLIYAKTNNLTIMALMQNSLIKIAEHRFAPLFLIMVFLIRPVLLLPVSILSAFSGYLFGPIFGLLYALIATSASASIAFGIARLFAKDKEVSNDTKLLDGLRRNTFESVLLSRLTFVPGDLVNYSAGFIRANYWQFLLATVIGGLPGLTMTVLAGSAIEGDFSYSGININKYYLLASLVLLFISLFLARVLRRRKSGHKNDNKKSAS